MLFTICQSLPNLHILHDDECYFSEDDDLEEEFETCRPRDRQISVEYDPDNDDYQIQVIPEVPEEIALMEEQLIKKQVAKLQIRMDQGGDAEILNHYRKV
ncbi:Pentatricopeptide repeat-containing protein, partial [Durusdinium trenchii]